ncbi:MAG TPA: hypothetical protein VLN59_08550 [Burkholderiales bacterium]|nr:hypothetical protein [Burkholderiales bacterium]
MALSTGSRGNLKEKTASLYTRFIGAARDAASTSHRPAPSSVVTGESAPLVSALLALLLALLLFALDVLFVFLPPALLLELALQLLAFLFDIRKGLQLLLTHFVQCSVHMIRCLLAVLARVRRGVQMSRGRVEVNLRIVQMEALRRSNGSRE